MTPCPCGATPEYTRSGIYHGLKCRCGDELSPGYLSREDVNQAWERRMDEMTTNTELLPCPFCGAPAEGRELEPHKHSEWLLKMCPDLPPESEGQYVVEGECACGAGLIGDTRAEVETRWNRRAPAAPVQPGFVMVPVEPTPEMLSAVDGEADDKYLARGRAVSAYKAMLAARPKAPPVGESVAQPLTGRLAQHLTELAERVLLSARRDPEIAVLASEARHAALWIGNLEAQIQELKEAIAAAVAAERDRCERACNDQADQYGGAADGTLATDFGKTLYRAMAAGAKNCVAAIRAGAAEKEKL